MKTKAEILESYIHPTRFLSSLSKETGKLAIFQAMEEYADQFRLKSTTSVESKQRLFDYFAQEHEINLMSSDFWEIEEYMRPEMKQTAMEFTEWKELNGWRKSDLKDCFMWHKDKKWHKKGDKYKLTPEQSATTAELFAKFEAERNQQQSELTCPECQSNRILEWPDKYQCRKCEHVWERATP